MRGLVRHGKTDVWGTLTDDRVKACKSISFWTFTSSTYIRKPTRYSPIRSKAKNYPLSFPLLSSIVQHRSCHVWQQGTRRVVSQHPLTPWDSPMDGTYSPRRTQRSTLPGTGRSQNSLLSNCQPSFFQFPPFSLCLFALPRSWTTHPRQWRAGNSP